jgi:hypothetical protein
MVPLQQLIFEPSAVRILGIGGLTEAIRVSRPAARASRRLASHQRSRLTQPESKPDLELRRPGVRPSSASASVMMRPHAERHGGRVINWSRRICFDEKCLAQSIELIAGSLGKAKSTWRNDDFRQKRTMACLFTPRGPELRGSIVMECRCPLRVNSGQGNLANSGR